MNYNLYSIKGATTIKVAMYFLDINVGAKIDSIAQFSKNLSVARGTIQSIIGDLCQSNVIELEKKGRLGTTLKKKDDNKLLKIIGKRHLLGSMPLPYTKRYEGLATGVISSLKELLLIQVSMSYMKNADSRISLLKEDRIDFSIVSEYHGLRAIAENDDLAILTTLGDYTYLSKHVIVKSTSKKVQSVGVDANSLVHRFLIEKNFMDVNLIQVDYGNLKSALKKGIIDATIMNYDDLDLSFEENAIEQIIETTRACILINKKNIFLKSIINSEQLSERIYSLQKKVMQSKIDSNF